MPCHSGPHVLRRQKGVRGKSRPESLLGLASTKKVRQVGRNNLRWASLNIVGRLWVTGLVSS